MSRHRSKVKMAQRKGHFTKPIIKNKKQKRKLVKKARKLNRK